MRYRSAVTVACSAANSAWTTRIEATSPARASRSLATAEAMRSPSSQASSSFRIAAAVGYRSDGSRAHARLAIRPRAWGTCGGYVAGREE